MLGHEIHGVNLNAEWRSTYPDPNWLAQFHVTECNIESEPLPYDDCSFDAVLFTEVLEHIAITDPKRILSEFARVLKPQGLVIFSTPNVCNISNIFALLNGENIFWAPQLFYGGHDRHNREYTPREVQVLFADARFEEIAFWGMSDYSNWRGGGAEEAYEITTLYGTSHPLLRNTIIGIFRCPRGSKTAGEERNRRPSNTNPLC
jgi:SAM-dependent methyltransferase